MEILDDERISETRGETDAGEGLSFGTDGSTTDATDSPNDGDYETPPRTKEDIKKQHEAEQKLRARKTSPIDRAQEMLGKIGMRPRS